MHDVIITDNVSDREFRTLQILYHMAEAFGETTDRHIPSMQNTAIDFLTEYVFFSTGSKDGYVTVSTAPVPKCNLNSLRHCSPLKSSEFCVKQISSPET